MRFRMLPARLDPAERMAIMLARSVHLGERGEAEARVGAARRQGLSAGDIDALLGGGVPAHRGLAKLVAAAWLVLDRQGRLGPDEWDDLRAAGVEPRVTAAVAELVGVELR